jgi:hypothetical protein
VEKDANEIVRKCFDKICYKYGLNDFDEILVQEKLSSYLKKEKITL